MLEIRKVAQRTKSCSKSEKLLKSCRATSGRATSGQPYWVVGSVTVERGEDKTVSVFTDEDHCTSFS